MKHVFLSGVKAPKGTGRQKTDCQASKHDYVTKLCRQLLIEQLGLPLKMIYYEHLNVIGKSYMALGDLENSAKHGMRLARYLVVNQNNCSDPNYFLRDGNFGMHRGRAGKAKVRGKGR
jgi:hypothetical protein